MSVHASLINIGSLLPRRLQKGIREILPVPEILDFIESLESPRTIELADGTSWTRLDNCPMRLLDPGGVQVGRSLYVIGGFRSSAEVSNKIHVFDMERRKWQRSYKVPESLPHSHTAVSTDNERYIYIAGGQHGPHCRPAVRTAYCFDTVDQSWHVLPPIPAPRYAGTMQLWRGRLHFIGGADVDRWTPTADHWSIGIAGNSATEPTWREETPNPIAGMHRCSAIVRDSLYVIGGQQGDFQPVAGDPHCTCTGRTKETYLPFVFRLPSPEDDWQRMSDLPIAVSHCDFACLVSGSSIYLFGGQIYKHPEEFYLRLTDAIQVYDTETDSWRIDGHLPHHLKMPVVGRLGEDVFLTVGQRGKHDSDEPGRIVSRTWVGRLKGQLGSYSKTCPLTSVAGKSILLISHELSRSGAPLELLELGRALVESHAKVRLVSLSADMKSGNVSAEFRIPIVPPEVALTHATEADLIVVNTASSLTTEWVEACLARHRDISKRIIWFIHEIDIELFGGCATVLPKVTFAVFDSQASLRAWEEIGALPKRYAAIHPGLPSDAFDHAALHRHSFVPASQVSKIAPSQFLTRSEIRAALGVGDHEVVVLSVGSVSHLKGQRMLLHSIARAARERRLPVKLLLAGFRGSEQRLAFLYDMNAQEHQVFNARLAYMTTPHINALFAASDVHILNSQGENGRGETFGRATVHAMTFGLPVLCTNAGGAPEIVQDGLQGYLYPVGDSGQETMIDRLEELVLSPDLRRRLGAAGSTRARSCFSKDVYLAKLDAVLRDHFFSDSSTEC